ncbi:MAG: PAS domain-containing sensor histidine kinase [Bacteroidota bacterium]
MEKNIRKEAEEILARSDLSNDLKVDDLEKIIHELKVHQIELELQNEELMKTQEELRQSQQKYFEYFDLAPVGYVIADALSKIHDLNLNASNLLNADKEKLKGKRFDHFVHPDYQDEFYFFYKKLVEERATGKLQSCLMMNGRKVFIYLDGSCEESSEGIFVKLTFRDNTIERLALTELEEVKERLELSLMAGNVAWWVWDYPTQIVTYDKKKAEMLGYTDGVMTQNVYEISSMLHPDDYEKTMQHMRDHLSGKVGQYQLEYRLKTKEGNYKWFYDHGKVTKRQADGKPLKISGVVIDITDRKNAELKLQQLNKELDKRVKDEVEKNRQKDHLMSLQARHAAMGEMIGYIAHQWKQPLNTLNMIVYDIAESALSKEVEIEDMNESSKKANSLIQHMAQTIDDFRDFFKPGKEKVVFNINKQIEKAMSLVYASLKSTGIPVVNSIDHQINGLGFPNEFAQVVVNILSNARDALMENKPNGPVIEISVRSEEGKNHLYFYNNGGHIPENIMQDIFKPYFSTKSESEGTGIGLYLSKIIIENNMEGTIIASNKKEGVEFEIVLPVVDSYDGL